MSSLKKRPEAGANTTLPPELDPIFGELECPAYKWRTPDKDLHFTYPDRDTDSPEKSDPSSAADRVRYDSKFHYQTIVPNQLAFQWRAWEIARFVTPMRSLGVIEQIGIAIDDVWAVLDGDLLYNYGPLNGQRPTLDQVVHPSPLVGALSWRFSLTATNLGPTNDQPLVVIGGAGEHGNHLVEPWTDLFSGSDLDWGQHLQKLIPSATVVRLFAHFRGPTDAFRVRVGGRLAGYTQASTGTDATIANAITRR